MKYSNLCPVFVFVWMTDLPLIFIGELGSTTGLFLAWFNNSKFYNSKFSGLTSLEFKAGFPN